MSAMKKTTEIRLNRLEERNLVADKQAKDDRVITIKEVYERVVALEVKYDMKIAENRKNTRMFVKYVYLLSFLTIVDITLSLFTIYLHMFVGW